MGMVVIQPYILVSKLKKNQDRVPTSYWLPKLHKNAYKERLLLILVLVREKNFLNCYPHALHLLKPVIKYC